MGRGAEESALSVGRPSPDRILLQSLGELKSVGLGGASPAPLRVPARKSCGGDDPLSQHTLELRDRTGSRRQPANNSVQRRESPLRVHGCFPFSLRTASRAFRYSLQNWSSSWAIAERTWL